MDGLSKVISMILAILLIFLLPLQYVLGHQLTLFDDYVEDEVVQLVDEMKEKRYLDVAMYEKFLKNLSVTGMRYEVAIEHAIQKEAAAVSSSENIPGVLVVSSDLSSLPKEAKIQEGDPTKSGELYSLATHAHTVDCYAEHRHTSSCYAYLGKMDGPVYIRTEGITEPHYGAVAYYMGNVYISCKLCGNRIMSIGWRDCFKDNDTPGGTESRDLINFAGRYYNSKGWALEPFNQEFNRTNCNYDQASIDFKALELFISSYCNQQSGTLRWNDSVYLNQVPKIPVYGTYTGCTYCGAAKQSIVCGQTQDETMECNQVVTSISATSPIQTVDKGGSITATATATYLDGHTATVSCTSNFNPNVVGTQMVTLTYKGLVDARTNGTRTCTVNVTVRETNIPSYLTVTPSSYTVYHGAEPTYTVQVVYSNGTSKILTAGYTKTGWSSGPGVKTVNFSYTENGKTVATSVNITVKPNIIGITVTPTQQTIERYTNPVYSITATYEDNSSCIVFGYAVSGFNHSTIGLQNVTVSYTENGITKTTINTVTVTPMKRICTVCANEYNLDTNDFDQGCPVCKVAVDFIQASPEYLSVNQGEALPIIVTATYLDGHTATVTGWSSNYDPNKLGHQLVMVNYSGKYAFVSVSIRKNKVCSICSNPYALNDDGSDPGCPVCSTSLVSISATPITQSLNQGDELNLTVTGIYKDGHSATLTGWISSYDSSRSGEQNVTVYYNHKSCNVLVKVSLGDEISCMRCGTIYNRTENPWGCPVCAGTLTGIQAVLKTGGTKVAYGSSFDLRVVLMYQDGHREMVFDGWTDNFDPFTLGEQTITVRYTDKFWNTIDCDLSVEVVDRLNQIVCENGHIYDLEDAESGCPYCAALIGEKVDTLSMCSYSDQILDQLYTNGIYNFTTGDYLSVKVSVQMEGSIFSFQLIGKKEDRATVSYGGEVA